MTEIKVPTLGESVTEATIATWFVKEGDTVAQDQLLCELETDKVTVEVPSPAAGVISKIVAAEGTTVGIDGLLGLIGEGASAQARPAASASPAPANQATGAVAVMMPTLGESVTEATINWSKSEGDTVNEGDIIAELETDKVSLEVVAPASGKLTALVAKSGETVAAGIQLASISGASSAGATAPSPSAPAPAAAPAATGKDIEHAPSAKVMMAEQGIKPANIQGSGRDGRIMKEDVMAAMNMISAPAPAAQAAPASASSGPRAEEAREERVKMTKLRQTIARRLKESQNTAAMLTTYNEVDMSAVMGIRNEYKDVFEKKHGVKLGFMSFFTKACAHALREIPEVNAEIDGTDIIYKNYVHMGIAVGTPNGLVVPVVRDAQEKSFASIEKEIADFGKRARDGKLTMAEMQGGSFTISNGGVYGSLMSSPILNPPQSGILGLHKIQERVMVEKGQMVIKPMMYLALSYDHRIVDGKGAVTFLVRVKEALEDPRRLLMDL